MKSLTLLTPGLLLICSACVPPQQVALPVWNPPSLVAEAEYAPFISGGSGTLLGQAFLTQRDGGVVKGAGRTVTLDPATTVGNEWWAKAGRVWALRAITPPSPGFAEARKTAVADAEGRFKFTNLAPGKYYVRTEVTWDVPTLGIQGGLVEDPVQVGPGQTEVILSHL